MSPTQPTTPLFVFLGRIFWMMVGPMILAALTISIVKIGNGWFTTADFAFLGVLAALVLARYFEFQAGDPQTSDGRPATSAHLRNYVLGAILLGLGVWAFANLLGNHWMTR